MNTQISPREWEAISAYLDGQLSAQEKQRFEERLKVSAELRAGLEDIQRTRALLRSLPQKRAPRNFTLQPEAIPRRRTAPPLFSIMRLASAVATFLLVAAFAGDLLISRAQLAYQAPSPNLQTQATQVVSGARASEGNPPVITWGTPSPYGEAATGKGGGGGYGGAPEGVGGAGNSSPYPNTGISPAPTEAPPALAAAPASPEPNAAQKVQTTETPQSLQALAPQQSTPAGETAAPGPVYNAQQGSSGPILGIRPPEERGTELAQSPVSEPSLQESPLPERETVRIAEVVLAVIALATALAAIILHRRAAS
jgi:hypothetical protein